MAQCKWCGKKGWFLRVDSNGLCEPCATVHLPMILRHGEIIIESGRLVNGSKNILTRLSRVRVAIRNCEDLLPYQRKGIPTVTTRPSDLIEEFARVRDEIVDEHISEQVYTARRKAEDAATPTGKLGGYAKAIEALDKIMEELDDVARVEAAIMALRAERDAIRFQQHEQKAEAALMKGNNKAALNAYVDAYMALKNDSTPDYRQSDLMSRAESKIKELGGALPS